MNRIIKAYERGIVFSVFETAIHFTIPILLENGDEIHYNCTVKKDDPKGLTYTTVDVPKHITIYHPPVYNYHNDTFR